MANSFPLIILPASVLSETFTNLDEAKSLAAKRTAQYSEDFVICLISELGRFEAVSPIWIAKEATPECQNNQETPETKWSGFEPVPLSSDSVIVIPGKNG